jgi:zinc transporter 2
MESPLLRSRENAVSLPGNSDATSTVDRDRDEVQIKLRRAILLSLALMLLEIAGGLMAHSLAIITDAAHLLSDVSGFAVSLFAVALSRKVPSLNYTYGYHQAEILGALTSVLIVWAMTGVLLFEACNRFIELQPVDGRLMLVMAVIGLVVNFALFGTLHQGHDHGHSHSHAHDHGISHPHARRPCASHHLHDHGHAHAHETHPHTHDHSHAPQRRLVPDSDIVEASNRGQSNLALDAALVHIIGDTVQSVGVLLAALLIQWQPFELGYTEAGLSYWYYADPACTVLFSILVMFTTFRTVSQSLAVLMHRVPENLDIENFDAQLRDLPGVKCIHDVHVWTVGSSNVCATAHVVVGDCDSCGHVLNECKRIASELGIGHSTFQLEVEGLYNHSEETFGELHSRDERCCTSNSQV